MGRVAHLSSLSEVGAHAWAVVVGEGRIFKKRKRVKMNVLRKLGLFGNRPKLADNIISHF